MQNMLLIIIVGQFGSTRWRRAGLGLGRGRGVFRRGKFNRLVLSQSSAGDSRAAGIGGIAGGWHNCHGGGDRA